MCLVIVQNTDYRIVLAGSGRIDDEMKFINMCSLHAAFPGF